MTSEFQYVLVNFYVDAASKYLFVLREKHFEPQKVVRDPGVLTVLTSESLSRHSVVQILATSWAADPQQHPFLGTDFASQRSHKTVET